MSTRSIIQAQKQRKLPIENPLNMIIHEKSSEAEAQTASNQIFSPDTFETIFQSC